ncbi:hypothetical protein ACSQ67_009112 [Phaseolus vulgaris]
MEKMNRAFEKVKTMVGMDVEDEEQQAAALENSNSFAFMDDFNRNCTLSTTQRLYGFAICFSAGLTCTLLNMATPNAETRRAHYQCGLIYAPYIPVNVENVSMASITSMLVFFKPIKFAIAFTLGNLLSLGSTAFLIGPKRQVTMMLDPARIYATAIYIASMIVALFCALYVHNKLLTLLAIILEFGALVWYSLSYIPFARSMVSKIMVSCFDTEF